MNELKNLNIVVADDDPNDHSLFCKAINESEMPVKISSVYNGMKLIDYLQITGDSHSHASVTLPDLIITDLYMPFAGGLQVLKQIRSSQRFRAIPIYVFSRNDDQVVKSSVLKNGATEFHKKPESFEELKRIVSEILAGYQAHAAGAAALKKS
jgi:CheY-like chemotaxis protein